MTLAVLSAVLGAVLGAGRVLRLLRLLNRRRPLNVRDIRETLRMPRRSRRLGRVRVTSATRLRIWRTLRLRIWRTLRLRDWRTPRLRIWRTPRLRGRAPRVHGGTSRLRDRLVGNGTVGAHPSGARGRPLLSDRADRADRADRTDRTDRRVLTLARRAEVPPGAGLLRLRR